jgi:hypothetical protein
MPSLLELQRRFARALHQPVGGDDPRIGIYRRNIAGNYRNALAASYPVVRALVGAGFFDAAVDSLVEREPPASGDLNVYGAQLAAFLAAYPHAQSLPYLPDVARLEWAIDESCRAADADGSVAAVVAALGAVAPERLPTRTLRLAPSCRLVQSGYPVLRIWQAHQGESPVTEAVDLETGPDHLFVRRDADGAAIERVAPATFAFLAALLRGDVLSAALDSALAVAPDFDLQHALATGIGHRTIVGVDVA